MSCVLIFDDPQSLPANLCPESDANARPAEFKSTVLSMADA